MFTGVQLEIVAYKAPDSCIIYCTQCWRTPGDTDKDERLERDAAIVRYDAEEYADGMGLYCEECGAEIVEPDVDEVPDDFYEEPGEEEGFEDRFGAESIYMEGDRDGELPGNQISD